MNNNNNFESYTNEDLAQVDLYGKMAILTGSLRPGYPLPLDLEREFVANLRVQVGSDVAPDGYVILR